MDADRNTARDPDERDPEAESQEPLGHDHPLHRD